MKTKLGFALLPAQLKHNIGAIQIRSSFLSSKMFPITRSHSNYQSRSRILVTLLFHSHVANFIFIWCSAIAPIQVENSVITRKCFSNVNMRFGLLPVQLFLVYRGVASTTIQYRSVTSATVDEILCFKMRSYYIFVV